jgi:hypothetical protein
MEKTLPGIKHIVNGGKTIRYKNRENPQGNKVS